MPIAICEYCGKPFNNPCVKLCSECSKIIDESYVKARRFIYQNPKISDFITIIQETEIPEKALSYLINKGRIEISNKPGSGLKCRACGKETKSGSLCEQCMTRLLSEKKLSGEKEMKKPVTPDTGAGKKKTIPTSFNN